MTCPGEQRICSKTKAKTVKTILSVKASRPAIKFVCDIAKRNNLPILNHVRCYANGSFQLTTTDLDTTLAAARDGATQAEGLAMIPASALVQAVAGKTDFELESTDTGATIRAGNASRNVPTLPNDEFPPLPAVPADCVKFTMPAADFMRALSSVANAQSTDASRYVLNGVCVEIGIDAIRLVATDGRRLHLITLPIEPTPEKVFALEFAKLELDEAGKALVAAEKTWSESGLVGISNQLALARDNHAKIVEHVANLERGEQILIPAGAVKHILRIPLDKKNPGNLEFSAWTYQSAKGESVRGFAQIVCGNYTVTTKLIDGNYPNFRQVIPAECKETIRFNIAELADAIRQAETVCTEKSVSVKLAFTQNLCTVTGNSPDLGEASAPVAIEYAGKEFAIAFNPRYLLSACESFAEFGPDMHADFVDELSPIKLRNDAGLVAVIMPMRLS